MKVVCISDTHGNNLSNIKIPNGDILIHTGDFTKFGSFKEVFEFNKQLGLYPHKYKIVIAGNHDIILDDKYYHKYLNDVNIFKRNGKDPKQMLNNCIYLNNESVVINGYNFYGSPYQPYFKNMGFNLERHSIEIKENWEKIPENTDILLTHTPPFGYGDYSEKGVNLGCKDLLNQIKKIRPKYNIYGHIHEGYGIYLDDDTCFINSSSCCVENKIRNKPIVFYLD